MLAFLATSACCQEIKWELKQTLKPDPDFWGIYGRAVAISGADPQRLVVGASWNKYSEMDKSLSINHRTGNATGALYVYQYDSEAGEYKLMGDPLYPKDDENCHVFNMGSTVVISTDGNRIVAGAPYSDVKSKAGVFLDQVGALVVWDYNKDSKKWEQTALIYNKEPKSKAESPENYDEGQGLGRSLTATPDCQIIASAYYNKPNYLPDDQGVVFITQQNADSSWNALQRFEPSEAYTGKEIKGKHFKFGASLKFVDASTLIVATYVWKSTKDNVSFEKDFGTVILNRKDNNKWVVKSIIPVPEVPEGKEYTGYGHPISMPIKNQNIFGVTAAYEDNTNTFYILENKDNTWKTAQAIDYSGEYGWSAAGFCSDEVFFTQQSDRKDENNQTATYITFFRKQNDGKYQKAEEFKGKQYPDSPINFGSDVQWGPDCKSIYVGAMSKNMTGQKLKTHTPWAGSEVLIYRIPNADPETGQEGGKLTTGQKTAIGVSVAVVCLIIIAIIVTVVILRKNKKNNDQSGADDAKV